MAGIWAAAENTLHMGSATITALRIFDGLSHSNHPKEALLVIRAVVIALVEGYQGKLRGMQIQGALGVLDHELRLADGAPDLLMIDKFKAAL